MKKENAKNISIEYSNKTEHKNQLIDVFDRLYIEERTLIKIW